MNLKTYHITSCNDCPFNIEGICRHPTYSVGELNPKQVIHPDCSIQRTAMMIKIKDDERRRKAAAEDF